MKKALKCTVPILMAVGILLSIGWYLFVYDREFTRDMLISQARYAESRGNSDAAARLYDLAYDYTGKDEDVAIELANQYKNDGNYTKAEQTLTSAIADGGTAGLYIALCKTYVEQDKLLDAAAMLDKIADPVIKMEMDRLRPAAPEPSSAPGYYNQYIPLTFAPAEGKLLITTNGDYPSITDEPLTEAITLPGGETTIYAMRVADNGLVSPLTIMAYTIGGVIEEAKFTDPAMELALREILGTEPEDAVMTNELWEITEFTVPADAESIADLSFLPYLQKLTIQNHNLDSLSFLAPLTNLKEVDLSGSRFPAADMKYLAALQDLEKLNLSSCGLSTIADLAGAKKLIWLDLSSNTLRNLDVLIPMTGLQELYLQHNAVTALDALTGLEALTKLDISYNSVSAVATLAACENLTWLNAGHNQIKKLDGMEKFTSLTHLYLNENDIAQVFPLSFLTGLTVLDLSDNNLYDIDYLETLVNLVELRCANNRMVHLPNWPDGMPLTTLDISHNQIGSLKPLAKMENLTYVYCDYNWLTTLDPIAKCYRLVMVSAFGNEITDISKLTEHNIIVNYDPTN